MASQLPVVLPDGREWIALEHDDGKLWMADMRLAVGDALEVDGDRKRVIRIETHLLPLPALADDGEESRLAPVVLLTVE